MRSSSISTSPDRRSGAMLTRRNSCLPLISTLSLPPPAWPVTMRRAMSSFAFCRSSCNCCACFMRLPKPPRICRHSIYMCLPHERSGLSVRRLDQFRVHLGAEGLAKLLHLGVRSDGLACRCDALRLTFLVQLGGGLEW